MKAAEIKRLYAPLQPLLPQFKQQGPLLYLIGPDGLLKGLYIEDSGFDKNAFYLWAFFLPLYVPTQHVSFTFGKRLANGKRWNNVDGEALARELTRAVLDEAIPFLGQADTPQQFAERVERFVENARDPYVARAKAYSLARCGNAQGAVAELRNLNSLLRSMDGMAPWTDVMLNEATAFSARVEADFESAKRMLDFWEAESRQHLRIS